MKNRSIAELLILFGVMFLPGYFSQTLSSSAPAFDSVYYHVQYAAQSVPHIALVLYFMSSRGPQWRSRYGFGQFGLRDIIQGLVVCIVLMAVAFPILAIVTSLTDTTASQTWQPEKQILLVPAIITFTLGAVREEAFFRSFLLTEIEDTGVSAAKAVIGSSLLFSVGHAYQGWIGIITTLVLGVILGAIFVRRHNSYEVAIGHALYNFSSLVFFMISKG